MPFRELKPFEVEKNVCEKCGYGEKTVENTAFRMRFVCNGGPDGKTECIQVTCPRCQNWWSMEVKKCGE